MLFALYSFPFFNNLFSIELPLLYFYYFYLKVLGLGKVKSISFYTISISLLVSYSNRSVIVKDFGILLLLSIVYYCLLLSIEDLDFTYNT